MRTFRARLLRASAMLVLLIAGGAVAPAVAGAVGSPSRAEVRRLGTVDMRALARAQHGSVPVRSTPAAEAFGRWERSRSGEGPSTRSALEPPTVPGLPVRNAEDGLGFEGLSHRDQAFASGVELEPPDQGLCGGKVEKTTFLVESVNLALAVYDTSADQYTPAIPLDAFYGLPPAFDPETGRFGPFLSDPKCYFDPDTRHWFHTVLEIGVDPATGDLTKEANTLVAVSATADPLGDYNLYAIDATNPDHPHCPCFGDQPLLGADANGLYVSTAEYSLGEPFGAFSNGAQVYALDKRALEAGSPGVPVHIATGTTRTATVQPATAPNGRYETARGGTEYFMSGFDCLPPACAINPGLGNRITVWALTHTASLRTDSPSVSLSRTTIGSEVYGQPVPQQQRPGFRPLGQMVGEPLPEVEPNDTRMNQVVYANGHLWSGLNTIVAPGPRDGIAWFRVRPSVALPAVRAQITRQGYVAARDAFVSFPSVGVNDAGHGVIAYSLMGPGHYPAAAWTTMTNGGAGGSVRVARAGFRPEDGFTCYPEFYPPGTQDVECRWGDYSASFALPNGVIWSAAEFIGDDARTTFANWGTFAWRVAR